MSKAIVCDKCGRVFEETALDPYGQEDPVLYPIWVSNPFLRDHKPVLPKYRDGYAELHLCAKHYKEFEDEYLANLKETYEQA